MIDSMKRLAAPQNLTALAYTSIKNYILHEDLDEHNRLTEEGLSRQLGISKSPVREATQQPSHRGPDPDRSSARRICTKLLLSGSRWTSTDFAKP